MHRNNELGVGRRRVLGFAGASVAALGASACVSPSAGPRGDSGSTGRDVGKYDNLPFEDGICINGPTGTDALGPYWTPNVRETIQLASPEIAGQRLFVVGHAYAADCVTPLSGALVVAWQADDEGLYDYNHAGLNRGSGERELREDETRLRGSFVTSVAGTYAFETIFPKEYPLNLLDPETSAYRAPHIHFAVFYTDRAGARHQLVTQMYFAPNALVQSKVPNIHALNAGDGGASEAETSRLIEVDGSARDIWHGQFDLVVDVDPSAVS